MGFFTPVISQDQVEETYNKIEEEAKYILGYIEKDIKSLEDTTEQYKLEEIIDGDHYMSEWETDGEKVYYAEQHILK